MAILTTIGLCVLGGIALTSAAVAGINYATEKDRAKAQIEENNKNIKAYEKIISDCNDWKTKLKEAKEYLNAGKKDFLDGGHVDDNKPLADSEFSQCLSKIDNSITKLDSFISNLNSKISSLKSENSSLKKKHGIK